MAALSRFRFHFAAIPIRFLSFQPALNYDISLVSQLGTTQRTLQMFTGSLRGNRSAGISELQGLHVCLHSA